jgi:hypothetical protein
LVIVYAIGVFCFAMVCGWEAITEPGEVVLLTVLWPVAMTVMLAYTVERWRNNG